MFVSDFHICCVKLNELDKKSKNGFLNEMNQTLVASISTFFSESMEYFLLFAATPAEPNAPAPHILNSMIAHVGKSESSSLELSVVASKNHNNT